MRNANIRVTAISNAKNNFSPSSSKLQKKMTYQSNNNYYKTYVGVDTASISSTKK